jgi:hypothetical protein
MSTDTQLEKPTYKVTDPNGIVLLAFHKCGSLVQYDGWPKLGMEPHNEAARRIAAYGRRLDPFCPKTPWLAAFGCFYLPATLPAIGRDMRVPAPRLLANGKIAFEDPRGAALPSPVPDDKVTAAMPWYDGVVGQVGRRIIEDANEIIAFLGWPPESFVAANSPAEQVKAYQQKYQGRPDMLSSPWCEFRRGLFLPALRELVQRPDGSWMEPPKSHRTASYPDGSYRPPSGPAFEAAAAAEVERVTGRSPGQPGSPPVATPSGFKTHVNRARPLASKRAAWKE